MKKRALCLLAAALLLSACMKAPDVAEIPSDTGQTEIQTLPQPETFPTEPAAFVRIADWLPHARVALAYATADNFTGSVIYDFTEAYLRYGTVRKLMEADRVLSEQGYGLVIWDAYRPLYAQERLWQICPDPAYVSPPGTGMQTHCRGLAVDVTLYDLKTGQLLEMPTAFDSFTALADRDYSDCTAAAAANAALLEQTLAGCGLKPYRAEWWHFSDTEQYEIEYTFDPNTQ